MSNSNMEGTRHTSAVCTVQGSLVLSLMLHASNSVKSTTNQAQSSYSPLNERVKFRNLDIETDFVHLLQYLQTSSTR